MRCFKKYFGKWEHVQYMQFYPDFGLFVSCMMSFFHLLHLMFRQFYLCKMLLNSSSSLAEICKFHEPCNENTMICWNRIIDMQVPLGWPCAIEKKVINQTSFYFLSFNVLLSSRFIIRHKASSTMQVTLYYMQFV